MIIIELNYTAPLSTIEMHLEDHKNFLKKYYKNKVFLTSGRKEPRTGGVILANGSQKEIELIIEEDPFKKHELANYSLTEFIPSMSCDEMSCFIEK